MNNTIDAAYCRLCAKLKPHNELANLQTDEETCQKVVNKLSRFNIEMDFQQNILPKTVCSLCIRSLEGAFAFITKVDEAQAFLSDFILVHIKTHESDSCEDNMLYEPPDENIGVIDLKQENSFESMEINVDSTNLNEVCDSEVMSDDYNDDFVTNENTSSSHIAITHFGNTEKHDIKNKGDIKPSIDNIVENTVIKDEFDKLISPEIIPDLNHDEENINFMESMLEKVHNNIYSEVKPLNSTVCAENNNIRQNNSNVRTKNKGKKSQKFQTKLRQCKLWAETKINRIQKKIKKKETEKSSNMLTKNTDTDVEHIKQTWQDYWWRCRNCESLFSNIEELQKHSMQYHSSCNPYQCTDCTYRRSKLNTFMNHVKQHRNDLANSCYKCFKKFPKRTQVNFHKRKVHENSKYVCIGCNTPFSSNRELKEHVNKYFSKCRTKTPSHLTCSKCNKISENAKEFQRHSLSHQTQKEWFCETCGKCYTSKGNLKGHIKVAHSSQKNFFSCDICNAAFCTASRLRNHKSVHTGIKPFTCDYCGKNFRVKGNMVGHMNFHRDRSHSCTICSKKFHMPRDLKMHMLQHTGEKPFSCHICLRDFTNLANRNKHMRGRHGIEMAKKKPIIVKQQTTPGQTPPICN